MAHVLTWTVLNQEQTQKCLCAIDINDVRTVLHSLPPSQSTEDDGACGSFPYSTRKHNDGQARILVDLYAHAILFGRSLDMSAAKLSSLIGILHALHETSMGHRLTRPASYDVLREMMVRHSVARPPYSAAIFSLDDVRAIDEYLITTYYRHYKMYFFAFVPKQTATVRVVPLGALTEVPPTDLPPLMSATPESEWRLKVESQEQAQERERMEEELRQSEALEAARLRLADLNDPHYSDGIREQLEAIRNTVLQKSGGRLDAMEEKLTVIEAKVDEAFAKSRPTSKGVGRKK